MKTIKFRGRLWQIKHDFDNNMHVRTIDNKIYKYLPT